MQRLWLSVEAETGRLLCLLFLWNGSLPSDPRRTILLRLMDIFEYGRKLRKELARDEADAFQLSIAERNVR